MSRQTVNVDKEIHDLIAALKDQYADVRCAAAYALGEIGPAAKDAAPDLIAALRDREAAVRHDAAWALGKIGPAAKDVAPALIAALTDQEAKTYGNEVDKNGPFADVAPLKSPFYPLYRFTKTNLKEDPFLCQTFTRLPTHVSKILSPTGSCLYPLC